MIIEAEDIEAFAKKHVWTFIAVAEKLFGEDHIQFNYFEIKDFEDKFKKECAVKGDKRRK